MKIVSFKVAKAIKEAGYSQEELTDEVYLVNCDKEGKLAHYRSALFYDCVIAPTYLEAWLWLWREKKIHIDVDNDLSDRCTSFDDNTFEEYIADDPEEAIIAAIEDLANNDLIK